MSDQRKRLTRREWVSLVSATGLAGLAGCAGGEGGEGGGGGGEGGEGGEGGGSQDGKTATFWAWNDPGLSPTREEQAEEFASMHDDIAGAEWQNFPFENYLSKVTNSIQAGNAPESAALSVLWVPRFADQGAVMNLDEEGFNADDFVDSGRQNSSYEGTFSAIPWYVDCRLVGINRDQFKEAGLEVPDRTYRPNWDEFADWIDTLASELDHGNGFAMPAGEGFDAWVLSNGGGWINDDATEAIINNDAALEAANYVQPKVVEDDTVIARPTGATDTGVDDFLAGNAPMYYAGSWHVPRLEDSDIDWQFIPFPSGPQIPDDVSHTWSAGVYYTVPTGGGADQDIGRRWLEYVASEEVQARVTKEVGGFPGLKSAYESDTFRNYIDENPRLETVEQEIENTKPFPSHPEVASMWDTVHTQAEALWQGEDPQTVLDRAAGEIESLL